MALQIMLLSSSLEFKETNIIEQVYSSGNPMYYCDTRASWFGYKLYRRDIGQSSQVFDKYLQELHTLNGYRAILTSTCLRYLQELHIVYIIPTT